LREVVVDDGKREQGEILSPFYSFFGGGESFHLLVQKRQHAARNQNYHTFSFENSHSLRPTNHERSN
jgi:hypothetical protein